MSLWRAPFTVCVDRRVAREQNRHIVYAMSTLSVNAKEQGLLIVKGANVILR